MNIIMLYIHTQKHGIMIILAEYLRGESKFILQSVICVDFQKSHIDINSDI